MTVTVEQAECHETCLQVHSSTGHEANINPVDLSTNWRVDCDQCGTCIRVVPTKSEAVTVAKEHVILSSEEYWRRRNAGE